MVRVYRSSSGTERRSALRDFVASFPPGAEILLVGASRRAADELAYELAADTGAVFGLHRTTLRQLAARTATAALAASGAAPATALAATAVAARAAFDAERQGALHHLAPIARCPGFAPALAATVADLRCAGVDRDALAHLPGPAADLAAVLVEFERRLARARLADGAAILRRAIDALREDPARLVAKPLALLDVAISTPLEQMFVAALVQRAPACFATVPEGDERTWAAWLALGAHDDSPHRTDGPPTSLDRLRRYLFSADPPPPAEADDTVSFFSAPGEARECVEIARRILAEAGRGVPFDAMAVAVPAPQTYAALLDNALRRAGIPAYFARGTRRPDPSGRALLALLACAAEGLSARRLAEYLSLGEVPALTEEGEPPRDRAAWAAPDDETLATRAAAAGPPAADAPVAEPAPPSETAPVVAGSLRAPWRWEALLTEAAVIGGYERWARRLHGTEAELRVQLARLRADDADSARTVVLERQLEDWAHLRRFALPVIAALAALPTAAPWSAWLRALSALAPAVLRRPERVLAVLAELQPLDMVGPADLHEVRAVLAERLATLETEPPAQRFGRVLVATPDDLRGHACEVVFVPGLAERLFPQKPREDPLLLDDVRAQVGRALPTQTDRGQHERARLRLAVGAARRRLYLSYPRLDVSEARPRVPSFYSLDVQRATRGRIPDVEVFERAAAEAGQARLAWPAPPDPLAAIDEAEYDLSVLAPLLRSADPDAVRGRGRYLLALNPHLARSLRTRWLRWQQPRWSAADGLARRTEMTAPILDRQRLTARPYSVSALQRFATCPYQFFLAAIQRLEVRAEVAPLERLDPLTRGRLVHQIQAETLHALATERTPPLDAAGLPHALAVLDAIVDRVADAYRDAVAPAIPRVWQDEIAAVRADLRAWLCEVATRDADWQPLRIEFTFGLRADDAADSRSTGEPAVLPGGFLLRGAVDLVEGHRREAILRVTDYKTGVQRAGAGLIVGGGQVLQPVLYGLAVEALLGRPVCEARLWFCTTAGGFTTQVVRLDATARRRGQEVLEIIDRAVAQGQLMPAPQAGACAACDFRIVCGPYEEERCSRKDASALADLTALRGLT
jgi:CRISPR/Cas system-associated exonuclease Cas4 (RecB family)